MGYDAPCTLILDGRVRTGTALLEQNELIFRGDVRLVFPLTAVESVEARPGSLVIGVGGRLAEFELGAQAEKWARRIANPPSRADKLGIKPGMRVAVINLTDGVLEEEVASRGASLVHGDRTRGLDLIFFGARRPSDLERLPALAARIAPAGALWLVRTKGAGAPIGEGAVMAAGKRAGLVDVKVVSFSDTQSAGKYVIPIAGRAAANHPRPPGRRRASS